MLIHLGLAELTAKHSGAIDMKRILTIVAIATMFTGCASTGSQAKLDEPSFGAKLLCANGLCSAEVTEWNNKKMFESARSDCVRMGFSVSSQQFPQCVQNQVINARNRETAENNARRIARHQEQINYGPETTACSGTGSTRTCNTTGGSSMFMRTTTCTGTGSIRTCTSN